MRGKLVRLNHIHVTLFVGVLCRICLSFWTIIVHILSAFLCVCVCVRVCARNYETDTCSCTFVSKLLRKWRAIVGGYLRKPGHDFTNN